MGLFAYINRCSSQFALGLHILGLGRQGGFGTSASLHYASKFSSFKSIETTTFCIFVYFLSQNKVTTWTELIYWVFGRGILREGKLAQCAVDFWAQCESVRE